MVAEGTGFLRASLTGNAFYLILSSAVTAFSGTVFWLVAARVFLPTEVGKAAALIPLCVLAGSVSTLGFQVGLIRFLPECQDVQAKLSMVSTTFSCVGLSSLATAGFLVGGLNLWPSSSRNLARSPIILAACLILVLLFALAPLLDAIFIAFRRSKFVARRSIIFNSLRVTLPAMLVGFEGLVSLLMGLLVAIFLAVTFALYVDVPRFFGGKRPGLSFDRSAFRLLSRFSLGNHAVNIIASIVPSLLPLFVLSFRSADEAAVFYVAWSVGSLLYIIPGAFATSFLAEGSHPGMDQQRGIKLAVVGALLVLAPASVLTYFGGSNFLSFFGVSYSTGGSPLLRWLVISAPFVLLNNLYYSLVQLKKKILPLFVGSSTVAFLTLALSISLLQTYGIEGVGIAWLTGQTVVSCGVLLSFRRGAVP